MQKVSIVIPLYNQSEFVGEAIRSCLDQTVKPYEIIVVNDGSTDEWEEAIFPYLEDIEVVSKKNGGLSSARNEGVRVATGDYIVCLDSDDKLKPDFIEKTLGKDDITGTWYQNFGDSNNVWGMSGKFSLSEWLQGNKMPCSAMFKKEIWEKLGGFDENMKSGWEDWDFWIRAIIEGYSVTIVEEPLLLYRKHGTSMISETNKKSGEIKKYMTDKYLSILRKKTNG